MSAKYRNPNQKSKGGPCKRCAEGRERIARALKSFTRSWKKGSK